jgi:hypothetical protein
MLAGKHVLTNPATDAIRHGFSSLKQSRFASACIITGNKKPLPVLPEGAKGSKSD